MFTGIIEEIGEVVSCEPCGDGFRLFVRGARTFSDLALGGSVAVNGCCLTAASLEGGLMRFDIVRETISRTRFDTRLRLGEAVNLERPLRVSSRLDGHFVQGHVDGVGTVEAIREIGSGSEMSIDLAPELVRYCVEKGSIAIDGVSLTCAEVSGASVRVSLIPHTLETTTLGRLKVGGLVSVEVDLLAKYVEKLLPK